MITEIMIYTSPGCPDCAALKQWLAECGVSYEERDLSQPGIAEQAKARCGVRIAPVTIVGEQCFWGTFVDQKPKLEAALATGK